MGKIDAKSMAIGLVVGYFVVPFVVAKVRGAAHKAA